MTKLGAALIEGFFKKEFLVFCTCFGTKKGQAADGIVKPGLPNEAFNVLLSMHFIAIYLIRPLNRAKFSEYIENEAVRANFKPLKKRSFLTSALNAKLKDLRTVYGFEATEDQKNEYLSKYNRPASKKKLNFSGPEGQGEICPSADGQMNNGNEAAAETSDDMDMIL